MIRKEGDVEPKTIMEMERSGRKLDMRESRVKEQKGSLDIRPRCQSLSKAFDISRLTEKDSPVSQRISPDIRNITTDTTD